MRTKKSESWIGSAAWFADAPFGPIRTRVWSCGARVDEEAGQLDAVDVRGADRGDPAVRYEGGEAHAEDDRVGVG